MEITTDNGNTKIAFSVTPGGNFIKTVHCRIGILHRVTSDPTKFVKMMIDADTWNDNQIKSAKAWWKLTGRFNEDLYRKIKAIRAEQR